MVFYFKYNHLEVCYNPTNEIITNFIDVEIGRLPLTIVQNSDTKYLESRGWKFITGRVPDNLFQSADIERISLFGMRK